MTPPFAISSNSGRGPFIWRALVVLCCIGVAVSIGSNLGFFSLNTDAITANTELSCRIGAFFVGAPVVRQPKESKHEFHHVIVKAEAFLQALKEQDCTGVKGARITTEQINRELHQLHQAMPKGGGGSSGSPSASPPGGGASGNAPPPHHQAAPPPATTTTPAPHPPPPTTTSLVPPLPPVSVCVKHPALPICIKTGLGRRLHGD